MQVGNDEAFVDLGGDWGKYSRLGDFVVTGVDIARDGEEENSERQNDENSKGDQELFQGANSDGIGINCGS